MKKIILTADYELFLGKETGTVEKCMIEPTEKLLRMLESSNSRMTIFWDILHFYRLLELGNGYPELKTDRIAIEKQIVELVKNGHDIQLHLHPHWLDAAYENGNWNFTYDRFALHNLSDKNNPDDINTISGCVSRSVKLIEEIIRKENPKLKLTTFRAGGYLAEPFDKISSALQSNGIEIDSSVCPGFYNENEVFSFDFRNYPKKNLYKFDSQPDKINVKGKFTEIPVATVKIPIHRNMIFTFIRRLKYPDLENGRAGSGSGYTTKTGQTSAVTRLLRILTIPRVNQFTTDSIFKEKFNYIFKRVSDYSTMILHPKLLNSHTFEILDDYLSAKKVQFISIKDFINQ